MSVDTDAMRALADAIDRGGVSPLATLGTRDAMFSVRVTGAYLEAIDAFAAERGISRTRLAELALGDYIDRVRGI